MAIPPPEIFVLSSWMPKETSGKVVEMWNIGTPSKNSLIWSILMSYFFSSYGSSVEKELLNFINLLELASKRAQIVFPMIKINALRRRVINFNPFKTRYAFYSDKHSLTLFKHFERILDNLVACSDQEKQLLQTASDFLNCFIDVYQTDSMEDKYFFFCRPKNSFVGMQSFKRLVIFKKSDMSQFSCFDSYGFGMTLKYALNLRIEAFSYIANAAKFPKSARNRLKSKITNKSPFLIGAISTCHNIVPYLYKTPYIAKKLSDGGIHIDPKITDKNGLSAFYHCISKFNIPLLRLLYNHASNNFDMSENNVRNPNLSILTALQEIGSTLSNDLNVLKELNLLGDKELSAAVKIYDQFLHFNYFQCSIVERILLIREEISDNLQQNIKVIVSIIEEYCKYFLFREKSKCSDFQNYITFKEYYDNLDLFTCFLLFDNVVNLNDMLDEKSERIYTGAIRSLFLFLLSHKEFPHKNMRRNYKSYFAFEKLKGRESQLRFIPFCYRNLLREDLITLMNELHLSSQKIFGSKHSSKSNSVNIDIVRRSISGLPEIENEFFAKKLRSYIEIIKGFYPVHIFSIERIIQIIGELICCSDINDTIFKFFLCSCLPKGVEKNLCDLRNHCFSHYRNNTVLGRLNIEYVENDTINCLRNEVKDLSFILEPIIGNHFLGIREFMIEKGKEESKDKFKNIYNHIHSEHQIMIKHRKMDFLQNKKDYAVVSKNLFHFIYDSLNKIDSENMGEFQVRLQAILSLSNYICTSLKKGDKQVEKIKICCEKLNIYTNNYSKSRLSEVKDIFMAILKDLELVYNNIFQDFEKLNRFEGRIFSRVVYFINVYKLLLKVFSNHANLTEISDQQVETELEQEMVDLDSSIFRMERDEINKLVIFSESLILMEDDNKTEHDRKLHLIQIFRSFLEKKFLIKNYTNENDLKFTLLNNIFDNILNFDLFSLQEKTQIEDNVTVYLEKSKIQIEELLIELENKKSEIDARSSELKVIREEVDLKIKKLEDVEIKEQAIDFENRRLESESESDKFILDLRSKKVSSLEQGYKNQEIEFNQWKRKLKLNLTNEEVIRVLKYTTMSQKSIKKCISYLYPKLKIEEAIKLLKSEKNLEVSIDLKGNVTNALKKLLTEDSKDKDKKCQTSSSKNIEMYRRIFLNIKCSPILKSKICYLINQKLKFLIDRIEQLEKILIDDDEKVKYLLLNGKSSAIKQHTKVLMCQRFIKERETRAALEMLFFDCLNVIQDSDLKEIWLKATNLFAGIDIRDYISHGSPVVELVSCYLDPKDLPLEIINKILVFIEDKKAIIALSELWETSKATRSGEFLSILRNDVRKDTIEKCTRWKKYFNLLPLEYGDNVIKKVF